jgi:hypothetical protein
MKFAERINKLVEEKRQAATGKTGVGLAEIVYDQSNDLTDEHLDGDLFKQAMTCADGGSVAIEPQVDILIKMVAQARFGHEIAEKLIVEVGGEVETELWLGNTKYMDLVGLVKHFGDYSNEDSLARKFYNIGSDLNNLDEDDIGNDESKEMMQEAAILASCLDFTGTQILETLEFEFDFEDESDEQD